MTREEHEQLLLNILANAGDQGKLTELLDNLRTDYTETLGTVNTLNTSVTELTNKNETLREVNSNMFMKLGKVDDLFKKDPTPEPTPQENDLSYDNLFNKETGGLI